MIHVHLVHVHKPVCAGFVYVISLCKQVRMCHHRAREEGAAWLWVGVLLRIHGKLQLNIQDRWFTTVGVLLHLAVSHNCLYVV